MRRVHPFISLCLLSAVSFAVCGMSVPTAQAEVLYVVEGPRGSVTFTTRQPARGERYRVLSARGPKFSRFVGISSWNFRLRRSEYDNLILRTAEQHALEPALVKAVVHVESAFDPYARSPKGAMGLMQLMPATAARFGVENAYRPEQNVVGGVKYLKFLHDRYEGDLRLVLSAYNAGENLVDRVRTVPPIRETQEYVRRVLKAREAYRCDYNGSRRCSS